MPRLSALYCYPVKSCRGVSLSEATLDRRGIVHDREMLIVDSGNRHMTQRATPALALIETELSAHSLILRAPRMGELRVPWRVPDGEPPRATREVTVWRDTVVADDTGDHTATWLSDYLGESCRLVTTGAHSRRLRPVEHIPADAHPGARERPVELAFPDASPLLVISEESLAELNGRLNLPEPLAMDRFRPNLVVTGCDAPYAEDTWKAFRVGEVRLFAGGGCGRCVMITTDQQTLARTPGPLRTLASYRRTHGGDVLFGQNAILAEPGGTLRVDDPVVPEAGPSYG